MMYVSMCGYMSGCLSMCVCVCAPDRNDLKLGTVVVLEFRRVRVKEGLGLRSRHRFTSPESAHIF